MRQQVKPWLENPRSFVVILSAGRAFMADERVEGLPVAA